MSIGAIVTIPPYAPFIREVARHQIVSGLRLNTVMPIKGPLEDMLKRLDDETKNAGNKELWIDLKCRQLRVKEYWVPPYTEIKISHNIKVETPVTAYFSDGNEQATVVEVDGDRLIMLEGPKRVVGPGESINIVHPSLSIEGFLTETDKRYIESACKVGIHNYMLSFTEMQEDIEALYKLDAEAKTVAKIESQKGMNYVKQVCGENKGVKPRLMAARGDLYVELSKPHEIIDAVETILKKDKDAIVASRLFNSFSHSLEPTCSDISDVDNLLRMGYKTFMLGDDICMRRESLLSALNLFSAMAERYV
ncbi:hypothetical protein J4434_07545 [Candidatus Woesearchaeota archaeon]|nr:hypothetical protein [Candidatus Woesearchaeota archaeon]